MASVNRLEMQIGKKGLTKEFLEDVKRRFEDNKVKNIKVSVLKSARESKLEVKKFAEEIVGFLGNKFTYRILGFSIFLKKWRKDRG
ncbi:RNA-binding protein [Candidatus Pacearchaeota archaeon]|jgi:RNA-binding protein YhbY|nr:RNA-binding protein [Candidatus Pacearchaeota archaeon]|tara:strand:+ start:1295 stop:1552 length:258 start_codon:yes stop_codon:yes gene_type:complete